MDKLSTIVPDSIREWGQEHPYVVIGVGAAVFAVVSYTITRRYFSGGRCTSKAKMQGKTVLITGSNQGIGLETARDMARRGARVLIACRNVSAGNDAAADIRKTTGNGDVEVYQLNLANLKSVRECAEEVLEREDRVDVLINNAGVMVSPREATTDDGFELQMGVNHLGHFLLTNLLLDRIKSSTPARIVNVSSLAHQDGSFDVNDILTIDGLKDWQIYGRSKLANVLFTIELNNRLKGTGVTTYALHPGVIKTNLDRHLPGPIRLLTKIVYNLGVLKTPVEGAQTNIYCAVQEGIEKHSGKYFSDCALKTSPNPMVKDSAAAKKLWDVSAELVGL